MKYKSEEDRLSRVAEVRSAIISSALTEFAKNGYKNTSIESIALGAGISKGSIFNYFPSKEILQLESALYIGNKHCIAMKKAVLSAIDPNERLNIFFCSNEDFIKENLSGMLYLGSCVYGGDEELKNKISKQYESLFGILFEYILSPGYEKGYFNYSDIITSGRLVMSILLNTSISRNSDGSSVMDPLWVANFVRRALSGTAE